MGPPRLTVVLLTWNEEGNIGACLRSLASQTTRDFEVVVIDAASTDDTVLAAREATKRFPVPVRIVVAEDRIPIGEARNRGVAAAASPFVAFVSADAEVEATWAARALAWLERNDLVFGRQVHAPHRWTVGASVRGLRYDFPTETPQDPLPYASNVAAAYRKEVLRAFPFDPATNAAEDLLLARRAHEAGYRAVYDPEMVVRHHDVAGARQELRKNVREGRAWGAARRELGLMPSLLAWGAALVVAAALLVALPSAFTLLLLVAVVWMPAFRRLLRPPRDVPADARLVGFVASPFFDLAFLANYVLGLFARDTAPPEPPKGKEVHA